MKDLPGRLEARGRRVDDPEAPSCRKLHEAGQPIEILSERDLFRMLGSDNASPLTAVSLDGRPPRESATNERPRRS
jgi:hypothetical protein